MLQFSEIESLVQQHLRSARETITSGNGLLWANLVQRRMVALMPWEDWTRIDETLSTDTSDPNTYTFPSEPRYQDVTAIYVQDWEDNLKYKRVVPARSQMIWNMRQGEEASFPELYRRYYDSASAAWLLEFRPACRESGHTIRIDGIIEPSDFTDGAERTGWRIAGLDDAYAMLIAGFMAAYYGQQARASQLFGQASEQIRLNTGKEFQPSELQQRILGAG